MKKFSFPLGRALDWRAAQARIEESKLEQLYAELRTIDARERALLDQRAEADKMILGAASVTSLELASVDQFRRFTLMEHTRLERIRSQCAERIAAQLRVVIEKRRAVKLIERLHDRRFSEWKRELDREQESQAGENYLANWNRN